MMESLWKLDLKSVLRTKKNVDEFEYVLSMIEETDFRRLSQDWMFCSKRRDVSSLFIRRFGAARVFYSPYSHAASTE